MGENLRIISFPQSITESGPHIHSQLLNRFNAVLVNGRYYVKIPSEFEEVVSKKVNWKKEGF